MRKLLLALCLTLYPVIFVHGLTVGVFDIRGDVGSDGGRLADLALVRQSRLSVMPVGDAHWRMLCEMAGIAPD